MTDNAPVKRPIMQISTLLRLKHCLRHHVESTSRNEFKQRLSHFLATFCATIRSVALQTLRTGVYLKEFKMVMNKTAQHNENGKLRAILLL